MYINNFRRFIILLGLTLTLLAGYFTATVFAQEAQQKAPAVVAPTTVLVDKFSGITSDKAKIPDSTVAVYNLKIGTDSKELDTPIFTVKLNLESSNNKMRGIVEGFGEITFIVSSGSAPLIVSTNLQGIYTILPFFVHDTHPINFDLTGFPSIHFPQAGGRGPVIPPNVKLNINLAGYGSNATYEYRTNPAEPWQTVNDVPVKVLALNQRN